MEEEFTTADDLQLQRLQQGMAAARKAEADGEISKFDQQNLMQQLMRQAQPLSQRKQQKEQQAKQKAYQEAMEQHAQMTAMQMQAEAARAKGFADQIAYWVDPFDATKTAAFYQKNGQWEQIKPDRMGGGESKEGSDAVPGRE